MSIKKVLIFVVCMTVTEADAATNINDAKNQNKPIGHDLLLIINYNWPHYDSMDFLRNLYKPYFPNIVFVGPQQHPLVEYCDHYQGWFSYKALAQIMNKYPGYTGYLWVHDDLIINPWNLTRFDKNKIWSNATIPILLTGSTPGWQWWDKPVGRPAITRVFHKLSAKHRKMLGKNCGENSVATGYTDIVYMPARFRDDILELCPLFSTEKSFLEIGLPTLCNCLEDKNNWETFNGKVVWYVQRPHTFYDATLDYFHPLKLSSNKHRTFITKQFKKHHTTTTQ